MRSEHSTVWAQSQPPYICCWRSSRKVPIPGENMSNIRTPAVKHNYFAYRA